MPISPKVHDEAHDRKIYSPKVATGGKSSTNQPATGTAATSLPLLSSAPIDKSGLPVITSSILANSSNATGAAVITLPSSSSNTIADDTVAVTPTTIVKPEFAVITSPSKPVKDGNDAKLFFSPGCETEKDAGASSSSYPFEDSEIIGLSETEIIEACETAPPLVAGLGRVVRLSEHTIVKFCWSMQLGEARNMEFVNANAPSIRVPKVIRSFQATESIRWSDINTYIVMEYVQGSVLSECWEDMSEDCKQHICDQVVDVISTLKSLHVDQLGPIGGGKWKEPTFLLFTRSGTVPKKSISDLERWYDYMLGWCKKFRREPPDSPSFAGAFGETLVMSHMDIAMRNIIVQEDNTICVIDWECSGAYPSHFERFVLERQKYSERDFSNRILMQLPEERDKLDLQASVRWAIQSMSFPDEIDYEDGKSGF